MEGEAQPPTYSWHCSEIWPPERLRKVTPKSIALLAQTLKTLEKIPFPEKRLELLSKIPADAWQGMPPDLLKSVSPVLRSEVGVIMTETLRKADVARAKLAAQNLYRDLRFIGPPFRL